MKILISCFTLITLVFSSCAEKKNSFRPEWTAQEKEALLSGLSNSLDSLIAITQGIPESAINQMPDSTSWSVAQVVEHLVLQDQAYYRELTAVSSRPEETEFGEDLSENDSGFLAYATDPNPGQADWFAVPTGNYKDFGVVLNLFIEVRHQTMKFIRETTSDLRRHYTYRKIPDELLAQDFYRIRKVRDLHQLMLNEIAHTYRHIGQIQRIRTQLNF